MIIIYGCYAAYWAVTERTRVAPVNACGRTYHLNQSLADAASDVDVQFPKEAYVQSMLLYVANVMVQLLVMTNASFVCGLIQSNSHVEVPHHFVGTLGLALHHRRLQGRACALQGLQTLGHSLGSSPPVDAAC